MATKDSAGSKTENLGAEKFVLQGFDPVTETVCIEWRVWVSDLESLRNVLAPDGDDDLCLERDYQRLSRRDMRRIGKLCRPSVLPDPIFTGLARPSTLRDGVPYMVHTNFELPLMLEGRKPFATFSEFYPSEWFEDYLAPFEPFIQSGRITRRIVDTPMPELEMRCPDLEGFRRVYFALPGEEWRIDAYEASIVNATTEWDDALERLQGSLLGYEDWQNDWWIEHRYRRAAG